MFFFVVERKSNTNTSHFTVTFVPIVRDAATDPIAFTLINDVVICESVSVCKTEQVMEDFVFFLIIANCKRKTSKNKTHS